MIIQNIPFGVNSFWLKAMLSSPSASKNYNWGGYKKQYNWVGNGRDTYISANNGGFTIYN